MKKHIYIAYTGGTVGMLKDKGGYIPAPGYLAEQLAQMPELTHEDMPAYTIHEYDSLLDSANMSPSDWLAIAGDIAANYHDYDGFIVLHGTDTMAYTASALPFMLRGLSKPVLLTGSQIPLCELRNDARQNLITSLLIASQHPIPEVCLYFGEKLLRGARAVKVDADGLSAFSSPNYPPLGDIGTEIEINWPLVRSLPDEPIQFSLEPIQSVSVAALRLFPGISASIVRNMLLPPLRGLVLEAYGVGNAPSLDKEFLAVLKEAADRGVVIVVCTQCLQGRVHMGDYATGTVLAAAGAISGFDMTSEAALAKMTYLLGKDLPLAEVKRLMQTNLIGELTVQPRTLDS
jgi:L-asparaginase